MADYTSKARIVLTVNGNQAKKILKDLEKNAESLRKKMDSAAKIGDKDSLKKLTRELNRVEKQINQIKGGSQSVEQVLARLDKASPKELNRTLSTLKRELDGIERGSSAWNAQMAKIKAVRSELSRLNAEMTAQKSKWDKFNGWLNNCQTELMGIIAAITGLIMAGRKAVNAYAEINEAEANTMKFTGMTQDQVKDLNKEFQSMNTRTAREELNSLAQEAGRLGKTTKEDVLGYVQAADIINVALSDLGEGATQSIAKLSNIFRLEDEYGTYNSMVKIGSVVNVLSQNCTASKPYLVEFANRLAGVGSQANISLQNIIGLGAVLDANAQKVEASATAVGQVLVRMYRDPAKYAKVAGLDVKEFTDLIKKDANEALLVFLETLGKAGKMDTLAPMFAEMGENGARVINALSTLSNHIDEVRWQQQNANAAFEEGTSVLREYDIFNNTAQAGIDKARKRIAELSVELGEKLLPIMSHVYTSGSLMLRMLNIMVDFFLKYKTEIAAATIAIVAYSTALNIQAIRTAAATKATALFNATLALGNKIAPVVELAFAALKNSIQYFTNGLRVNYEMQKRWSDLMSRMKFAHWTGLVTAAAAAIFILVKRMSEAKTVADEIAEQRKKIDEDAVAQTKYQLMILDELYSKTQDQNAAEKERLDAIQSIRKIYPDYFKDLSDEAILAGEAADAYSRLRDSILESARAKGRENRIASLEEEIQTLQNAYEKEARPFMINKMKAREANNYDPKKLQSDPDYRLAEYSLKILEEKYLKRIEQLKREQESLASKNLALEISKIKTEKETEEEDSFVERKPTISDKERKKLEAEARKEAAKLKKEFREALDQVKGARAEAETQAMAHRSAGLIDYRTYLEKMRDAEVAFYENSEKVYKQFNLEEDEDYKTLLKKRQEADDKYNQQRIALNKEAIERIAKIEEQEITARYNSKSEKSLADDLAYKEQLLTVRYNKLIDLQSLYLRGSKEWEQYEEKIQDLLRADQEEKQKLFLSKIQEYQKKFDKQSVAEKYKLEFAALEELYKQKKITEEQYQKWLKGLKEQELKDLPGSENSSSKSVAQKNQKNFEKQKKELDDALQKGQISQEEYDARLARIGSDLRDNLINPLKEAKSEWVSMITTMIDSWMDFADALKDPEGDPLNKLAKGMEATAAIMSAVFDQLTTFIQAELTIQTKAIEKKYDKEISLAEGNRYKVAKLEKEKEEKIANLKDEANRKMYSMKVYEALAQTATAALNAYSSALAIPVAGLWMAPIAAAVATAAGLVQVAAIRKQQAAANAQGYSEGGFTKEGDANEPVGIVHAGEWVASQKLLKNQKIRPIIDILEYAQRNNVTPDISMADVSMRLAAPAVIARNISMVDNVTRNVDIQRSSAGNSDKYIPNEKFGQVDYSNNIVHGNDNELKETIEKLKKRLDEPFVSIVPVAGDKGFNRALNRYERLMKNKGN